MSLAMNQSIHGASSSAPTLPPASIASGSSSSIAAPPVISAQPVPLTVDADADADAPLTKSITLTVC